jgi:hypothetical protein
MVAPGSCAAQPPRPLCGHLLSAQRSQPIGLTFRAQCNRRTHQVPRRRKPSRTSDRLFSTVLSVAQPVVLGAAATRAVWSGLHVRTAASLESGHRRGGEFVPITLLHAHAAWSTHGGPMDFAAAVATRLPGRPELSLRISLPRSVRLERRRNAAAGQTHPPRGRTRPARALLPESARRRNIYTCGKCGW